MNVYEITILRPETRVIQAPSLAAAGDVATAHAAQQKARLYSVKQLNKEDPDATIVLPNRR